VTDFSYCCYVSDRAVDRGFQRSGIGKTPLRPTKAKLTLRCKLLLFAAPNASAYYAHIGFESNPYGWVSA
jgi:hypothetical protein